MRRYARVFCGPPRGEGGGGRANDAVCGGTREIFVARLARLDFISPPAAGFLSGAPRIVFRVFLPRNDAPFAPVWPCIDWSLVLDGAGVLRRDYFNSEVMCVLWYSEDLVC